MKKSVVLLITIIYVASIAIIGVFGMKIAFYNEIIYVNKIECINDDAVNAEMEVDGSTKTIQKVIFDINEQNTYWIQWRVYPSDATNRNVKFSTAQNTIASVDENTGLVTFNRKGSVTVYITAVDGSNIQGIVKVTAWAF